MGLFTSKPEFVTVLDDKQVKIGEDVSLSCKANTKKATWKKNGEELVCVNSKHSCKHIDKSFVLEIKNAGEEDEGNYSIYLSDSTFCSAMVTVELNELRTVQWNQDEMIKTLNAIKISNAQVRELRFLLYGPIGAGKSSVINTINTIFEGRIRVDCPVSNAEAESSKSYTLKYEKYQIGNAEDGLLSLAFSDTMGVEQGEHNGVRSDDIINALKGHIKEGYTFNSTSPLTEDSLYYLRNPGVNDKIHCLVNVIPADKLSMIKDDFIKKMKVVREGASTVGILQVVLMTRVDVLCSMTNRNLRNVYKSKKIKDKIRECSLSLGVPENCIFPVCNYYRNTVNKDVNCLMLDALSQIVQWTDDYMVKHLNK